MKLSANILLLHPGEGALWLEWLVRGIVAALAFAVLILLARYRWRRRERPRQGPTDIGLD